MEIQQLIPGYIINSAQDFYFVRLQHCGASLTVVPLVCPSAPLYIFSLNVMMGIYTKLANIF